MTSSADKPASNAPPRIVVWGTFDLGKPRTRILISALRDSGFDIVEIHKDIWGKVEDKSQVSGLLSKLGFALRWLLAYPGLIWRYLRAPKHELVVVPYLGQLDVIVLWPFARLRGARIMWDAFLSLWDTIIADRAMASRKGLLARVIHAWEWLGCRTADRIVLDTFAQAKMFSSQFGVSEDKVTAVPVGAEASAFAKLPSRNREPDKPLQILFYGQFIPLHGIETIIEAAQQNGERNYRWVIIGEGQESDRIARKIADGPTFPLERHSWVAYKELRDQISAADICLGIFGTSEKAARVIPNKAYQILLSGKPLITQQSPAAAELLRGDEPGIRLVPPGDPAALLDAIDGLATEISSGQLVPQGLHGDIVAKFSEAALAERWQSVVKETMA